MDILRIFFEVTGIMFFLIASFGVIVAVRAQFEEERNRPPYWSDRRHG